jgi:hypothetical protein
MPNLPPRTMMRERETCAKSNTVFHVPINTIDTYYLMYIANLMQVRAQRASLIRYDGNSRMAARGVSLSLSMLSSIEDCWPHRAQ